MAWQGILGHDQVVEHFRTAMARGRLASSFLFVGPSGIGKRTFALKLAQTLLCHERPEAAMDPCGRCPSCQQVAAMTHPDLQLVSKPADKTLIPLALLIGDDEHRGREGLCHHLSLTPFMGGRKVAILDDADLLNPEGANSLLKTLEEPPPRSVLILLGTSPARQLPTIRSRCQLIRFQPLPPEMVTEILVAKGLIADRAEAARAASHSEGSVTRAVELAAPELWAFRSQFYQGLAQPVLESVRLAGMVLPFVEAAGKDAGPRRARTRQVLQFAVVFYQHLIHAISGSLSTDDADLRRWVEQAARTWPGDTELAAACLDRTLEAAEQIERMVHVTTLLEGWLDGLAALVVPARPVR